MLVARQEQPIIQIERGNPAVVLGQCHAVKVGLSHLADYLPHVVVGIVFNLFREQSVEHIFILLRQVVACLNGVSDIVEGSRHFPEHAIALPAIGKEKGLGLVHIAFVIIAITDVIIKAELR